MTHPLLVAALALALSPFQSSTQPLLSPEQVRQKALDSAAPFATTTVDGKKVPAPGLRFDVNFNAAARLWYVLQYDATNPAAKAAVVAVDDVTGVVRPIS